MRIVTDNEVKNNFSQYLDMAIVGETIIITRNGKPAARLIKHDPKAVPLSDSLAEIQELITVAKISRHK